MFLILSSRSDTLYEGNTNGTAAYIYGPHGRLAKRTTAGGESHTFYYHADNLGSTRLVTDSSKNIVSSIAYQPFGEISIKEGSEDYLFTGRGLSGGKVYTQAVYVDDPDRDVEGDEKVVGVEQFNEEGELIGGYKEGTNEKGEKGYWVWDEEKGDYVFVSENEWKPPPLADPWRKPGTHNNTKFSSILVGP